MFGSNELPALNSGVICEYFHMDGISWVDNDRLKRSDRGYIKMCGASLRNLLSKPSKPGLLHVLRSLMAFSTSSGEILLKEKELLHCGVWL